MRCHVTSLGLAFTRFRYLTDFQEINKCNNCFVTILNNIFKRDTAVWPTNN